MKFDTEVIEFVTFIIRLFEDSFDEESSHDSVDSPKAPSDIMCTKTSHVSTGCESRAVDTVEVIEIL